MFAFVQIAIGLSIAHGIWLIAYLTGSVVAANETAAVDPGRATLRIVLQSATGIAICGFQAVLLGFVGLLSPLGLLLALACSVGGAAWLLRRTRRLDAFWSERAREVAAAARGPAAILYALMLLLSTAAAFPDYSSDGLRIHLPYAYEWAQAGHIFADHRFRFPYYTFNNEVLYATMMVCGAGRYIAFLNWLSGALAIIGIYGLIANVDASAQAGRDRISQGAATIVYTILPIAAAVEPVMLRWGSTAMPDVAASMLLLAGTAGVVLALLGDSGARLSAIVCVAFLAGTKPSFLFFVPFLALAAIAIARLRGEPARRTWIAIAVLAALTSPWYIRNIIAEGDPIPPLGHFAMHQADPDFTPAEWRAILNDLHPDRSLRSIETYPWRLFFDTQTTEFREYGVNAVIFALYGIVIVAPFLLVSAGRSPAHRPLAALVTATLVGCIYLFASSILARYALLIYPLVAASGGALLLDVMSRVPRGIWVAPAIAVLSLIPSPGTHDFYDRYDAMNYDQLAAMLPNDRHALELLAGGYKEAEPVLDADWHDANADNVLLVVADLQYFVERCGAHPIGDWTGQTRYADFIAAIDNRTLATYLARKHVGAIVLNRQSQLLIEPEYDLMRHELLDAGFVETAADAGYASFIRRSIKDRTH